MDKTDPMLMVIHNTGTIIGQAKLITQVKPVAAVQEATRLPATQATGRDLAVRILLLHYQENLSKAKQVSESIA